ncbi:expressed unknown protein [Seminavis robusta]|uniref:Uncharacterized protein n=1 Tax=Seminavis robusta TaxID=568900 RepID=A0A9N8EJR2_9STRA|nr:expressed unknown protein [Seminavis robusta]|eukprot:Sro1098_g240960.1 n/a (216) ;mRNA; f:12409-13207
MTLSRNRQAASALASSMIDSDSLEVESVKSNRHHSRAHHKHSFTIQETSLPSTAAAVDKTHSFVQTTKYDPSSLPAMSSHTSLLDVIRSQGHVMLQDRVQQAAPSMPAASRSKPIRIVSPGPHHQPHYDLQEELEEDPLSTSAELERFYDHCTWRMYALIQTARQTSHYSSSHHHHQPSRAQSRYSNSRAAAPTEWTTSRPPAVENEDDIFDLEL